MAKKLLTKTDKPKFFEFIQNNSGGSFVVDEQAGIDTAVIIEARSAEDANDRAENIGIYFDGCDDDRDCPCCGDRWSRIWREDGSDVPTIFGEPIEKAKKSRYRSGAYIHYLDGRIEKITFE